MMRPILLEMDGFCSYRTHTTIDFRDADFFALVGATGSGKSTIIDAMVFALYGTVPRWASRNAVAPALAPTVNRGVVRLIFDAGGARYVAVRDIRRGGKTAAVSVKEARLERFVSGEAVGEPADETTVLAAGSPAVSSEIEKLLGLNYEQFTQSVALPQGEFARFLHATDGERQAILKDLLGYNVYELIQSAARARAADAESKAVALADQLGTYADASEQRVDELTRQLDARVQFQDHVNTQAVPDLKTALADAAGARGRAVTLTAERDQLLAVEIPDGVHELDSDRRRLAAAATDADRAKAAIELQDTAVREQIRETAPRHELERVLADWQELAQLDGLLPNLAASAEAATAELEIATNQRTTADTAARAAREAVTAAEHAEAAAQRAVDTARDQLNLVAAVTPPEDVHQVAESVRTANATLAEAHSALETREAEQRAAADTLAALPDPTRLAEAESAAVEVRDICDEDIGSAADRDAAAATADAARTAAEAADDQVRSCEDTLRAAEHADRAAALRADLHAGDDCPVCGQVIAELCTAAAAADVTGAQAALQKARAGATDARGAATRAQDHRQKVLAVRAERLRRCDTVRAALVARMSGLQTALVLRDLLEPVGPQTSSSRLTAVTTEAAAVSDTFTELQRRRSMAEDGVRAAQEAADAARAHVRAAQEAVDDARQTTDTAFGLLNRARDRVSALEPPPLDGTDVAAAWARLAEWARGRAATLADEVTALAATASQSRAARQGARDQLCRADATFDTASSTFTDTAVKVERAERDHAAAVARRNDLTAALADRAPAPEVSAHLERVIGLEAQLADIGGHLAAARAAADAAHDALTKVDGVIAESWRLLRKIRDPLAGYGAPDADGTDLFGDWQRLQAWAATEGQARAAAAAAQLEIAATADTRADRLAAALAEELLTHGVELSGDLGAAELADRVPAAAASAVTAAKGQLRRAEERLRESQIMRSEVAGAHESAQVARALSNLMHTQHFPRWLISGALDALLLDASNILLELSGGQFELARDDRELLVVDHNDADMSRPVKTLSGGETFQASLALALALSEQVTSLSAVGASKLESIFLDEGFGTLDETTLDVVAGTLENLAASGSRMVGVITHVAALAERIPVRFQVNRDSAGSHVERLKV